MSCTIGLTGGIATGKSHVSDVLRAAGATVVDTDRISHQLTAPGGEALPLIRGAFGDGVFNGDALDRAALGKRVFSDPEALALLNRLTHPLIFREIGRQVGRAAARGDAVIVLDAPLMYETGLDRVCDEVWSTWTDEDTQLSRLMARDGLTREDARARMDSQMSAMEKRRRAARWIDTSGSLEETAAAAQDAYSALLARLGAANGGVTQ